LKIIVILGIDPGTATTGFSILRQERDGFVVLDFGIISTDKNSSAGERLKKLYCEVGKLLKKFQPNILAVEKLYFFKNLKTALPVSEARGVVLLATAQKKVKVIELTPLEVKMGICGYGRADKKQVQKMVQQILGLEKIPKPDDAADALAIAICGALKIKSCG